MSIEDELKEMGIKIAPKSNYTKVKTNDGYIYKSSFSETRTYTINSTQKPKNKK